MKRIEYSAFSSCENLKNIRLPDSLEHIGKYCFEKSGLQTIHIPKAGVQVDEDGFDGCPAESGLVFRDGRVFPKDQ